jgi:predicted DNA-binding helix-hairpin-helix protein
VRPFIVAEGWSPHRTLERSDLRAVFAPEPEQLSLL